LAVEIVRIGIHLKVANKVKVYPCQLQNVLSFVYAHSTEYNTSGDQGHIMTKVLCS